jgi:hypothetical protein
MKSNYLNTDITLLDDPMVHASSGFCGYTGYSVYMYIHVYMYVCMYSYVYVHVHIYIHIIYIYIYIYIYCRIR